jgi:polar amino acid transport system substrate-binding protein
VERMRSQKEERVVKKLYVVIIFTMLNVCFLPLASAEPLIWVTDDTPGDPYIIGGGTHFNPDLPGIEIEIYREVARQLNLDVTFKRMPWKRCLQLIEYNQVQGVFPASFKEKRMKIGVYPMKDGQVDTTRKTRNNAYYLYKMKSSPISFNGSSFENVSGMIGVPIGWAIVDDLKNMQVTVKELPVHENSLDILVRKRIDGFVCLETVFDGYIKRNPTKYSEITKVSTPIWEKPYYLIQSHAFVNANPELARKIWDTILTIKKSEAFNRIVDKYLE